MSELKETKKLKLLHYMSRPQKNLNLIPTLKIIYFGPQKAKKTTLKLGKHTQY